MDFSWSFITERSYFYFRVGLFLGDGWGDVCAGEESLSYLYYRGDLLIDGYPRWVSACLVVEILFCYMRVCRVVSYFLVDSMMEFLWS